MSFSDAQAAFALQEDWLAAGVLAAKLIKILKPHIKSMNIYSRFILEKFSIFVSRVAIPVNK